MEAAILTIDVVVMTYLCWRIVKNDGKQTEGGGLGWLSFKKSDSE